MIKVKFIHNIMCVWTALFMKTRQDWSWSSVIAGTTFYASTSYEELL